MNIAGVRPRSLLFVLIGLVIGLGLGYVALIRPGNAPRNDLGTIASRDELMEDLETAPVAGALAPDFSLETIDGRTVRLHEFQGQPVLINFWATWCGPCRLEMPEIEAKFKEHAPDLVVLAVNFDEPVDPVRAYVEELDLTFDVLLDPGGEVNASLYRVRGYPSSFFLDEDQIIRIVHIGLMTEEQLAGYLKEVGVEE